MKRTIEFTFIVESTKPPTKGAYSKIPTIPEDIYLYIVTTTELTKYKIPSSGKLVIKDDNPYKAIRTIPYGIYGKTYESMDKTFELSPHAGPCKHEPASLTLKNVVVTTAGITTSGQILLNIPLLDNYHMSKLSGIQFDTAKDLCVFSDALDTANIDHPTEPHYVIVSIAKDCNQQQRYTLFYRRVKI